MALGSHDRRKVTNARIAVDVDVDVFRSCSSQVFVALSEVPALEGKTPRKSSCLAVSGETPPKRNSRNIDESIRQIISIFPINT